MIDPNIHLALWLVAVALLVLFAIERARRLHCEGEAEWYREQRNIYRAESVRRADKLMAIRMVLEKQADDGDDSDSSEISEDWPEDLRVREFPRVCEESQA